MNGSEKWAKEEKHLPNIVAKKEKKSEGESPTKNKIIVDLATCCR